MTNLQQPRKKKKKGAKPQIIYIRKLSKRDHAMLDKLQVLTGCKANATKLMRTGYLMIEKLKEIEKLEKVILRLNSEVSNERMEKSQFMEEVQDLLSEEEELKVQKVQLEERKKRFIVLCSK